MSPWPKSKCRSCRAPIIWTTSTDSGKRLPVDAAPVPSGNIVLTTGNDGPRSRVLGGAELRSRGAGSLYVAHFTTCPEADTWRKRR